MAIDNAFIEIKRTLNLASIDALCEISELDSLFLSSSSSFLFK